ncbi:MAG: sigma-70 family RNA polymerase sigma factor [Sandaracinaceae bacterium]|nr:sigma-70 family RNA polymerase sigma factor [Sandaracinaceae bacterium]
MDDALEGRIRDLLERAELEAAATEAMRGYGPAVYRFLVSRMGDEDRAADAFGQLGEDLWRGLEGFRGSSSFMTWMFTLARNAAHRIERSPSNRRRRYATTSALEAVTQEVRSRTAPYLRTEIKDKFRAIREELSPEERALLHLRIDEDLEWNDVARVIGGDAALGGPELRRASMRLRKQFSELKRKLRERAEAEGLLDVDEA